MGVVRSAECERARSRVSLMVDGELSELEQASLRAHVGRCVACARFERDMVALTTEIRSAPLARTTATAFVLRRPDAEVEVSRSRSATVRMLQVGAAAAAVVLAAGLGSLAGSLSTHTTTTATTARTGGGNLGAVLDRGIVAMAPGQRLPASRIRPSVAL
jgi:anti-sigma factor RsiW